MAKACPDAVINAALNYIAECDLLIVCSTQPTTYTQAITDYKIADIAITPGDGQGDFVVADDAVSPYGRKLTIGAQSAVPIDTSATALHIALTKSGDTTLRYVTTCTSQALTSGGTVDVPAFKIQIGDPT